MLEYALIWTHLCTITNITLKRPLNLQNILNNLCVEVYILILRMISR